jgi:hypothetical protein
MPSTEELKRAALILEIAEAISNQFRTVGPVPPEFFPLPDRGPDPHFGLSRSMYYDLEKRGKIMLVRLRKAGNLRGKVLVRYRQVLEYVEKCHEMSPIAE